MKQLFIPYERLGIFTGQKSIGNTAAALNALQNSGITLFWQTRSLRLSSTPTWPEGRYYQGGFVLEDSATARDILLTREIIFEEQAELPLSGLRLKPLKIAFYDGSGADSEFAKPLRQVLELGNFSYRLLSDQDIRAGKLTEFDLLLVPGSPDAGECYYAGLGDKGYDQIRSYIADHGHYMGICGGAYLPLTAYHQKNPYWLNIVNATDEEDLDYWRGGSAFVRCRIDEDQHPIFAGLALGSTTSLNLVYWEGPAIKIMGEGVKPLAHFERMLASGVTPLKPQWDLLDNQMAAAAVQSWHNYLTPDLFDKLLAHKCAFAEASYHKHKLLLYSPHPEMGNLGSAPWAESQNFLLIYNGLFYLSSQ